MAGEATARRGDERTASPGAHSPLSSILQLARPLLVLGTRLRATTAPEDPVVLWRNLKSQLLTFQERARAAGLDERRAELASRVLCAYIDLAAMSTPWGGKRGSYWMDHPLSVDIWNDLQAGRGFSKTLERALENPNRFADVIELCYSALLLGMDPPPNPETRPLAELESAAARAIKATRSVNPSSLSPRWRPTRPPPPVQRTALMPWVAGITAMAALFVLFAFYRSELADASRPYHLAILGGQVAPAPLALNRAPTRFADLLAGRVRTGQLKVDELRDGITRVRLMAPDMFASGSAKIDPGYLPLIRAIGIAAQQVHGRLTVVGHTDSQPIHSFRYANNFELSEARAKAVAGIVRRILSDPTRVSWSGVGDSEPLPAIPDLPPSEIRERNRRVEILYFEPRIPEEGGAR